MPDVTLRFSRAQWASIEAAFAGEEGKVPTSADMRNWLLRQVRARVLRHQVGQRTTQAETEKRSELAAEGW